MKLKLNNKKELISKPGHFVQMDTTLHCEHNYELLNFLHESYNVIHYQDVKLLISCRLSFFDLIYRKQKTKAALFRMCFDSVNYRY
jgi:hypothetical protein